MTKPENKISRKEPSGDGIFQPGAGKPDKKVQGNGNQRDNQRVKDNPNYNPGIDILCGQDTGGQRNAN